MTLRRGETLLLTVGIPVLFLLFFSTVHVVSTPTAKAVDFFVPGILALAVMSTAMVSLGIATGFERGYGVLKRLGSTPLGRPRLLGAKISHHRGGRDRPGRRPHPRRPAAWVAPGRARPASRGARRGRGHPAGHRRLRRLGLLHGRRAQGRGEPGRGQRALPGAPLTRAAWWSPSGKLPGGLALRRQGCFRPRRCLPACTPLWARARRCRP